MTMCSSQPAPSTSSCVEWRSHQVRLLPKEPVHIISEIKFNPQTHRGGYYHYPHLSDEEIEVKGGCHLAEVIISSRGRISTRSAHRELQRPGEGCVCGWGDKGTLRVPGEALWGHRGCRCSSQEPGFPARVDFLTSALGLSSFFFPSDSESPFSFLPQAFFVPLGRVPSGPVFSPPLPSGPKAWLQLLRVQGPGPQRSEALSARRAQPSWRREAPCHLSRDCPDTLQQPSSL